jgi:hypothetical protein
MHVETHAILNNAAAGDTNQLAFELSCVGSRGWLSVRISCPSSSARRKWRLPVLDLRMLISARDDDGC